MARRRNGVPREDRQRQAVICFTLPVAQRNALKAVLSLEGTTLQAYFVAKAMEKIARGPGMWSPGPQGMADAEPHEAVGRVPGGPATLRHCEAQPRVSGQCGGRLARLEAVLTLYETTGQTQLWVRDGEQMHRLELATLRERLAQALAQQHLLCVRCLHVWQPFIPDPALCPHCQQDWSTPYRRRPYGVRAPAP